MQKLPPLQAIENYSFVEGWTNIGTNKYSGSNSIAFDDEFDPLDFAMSYYIEPITCNLDLCDFQRSENISFEVDLLVRKPDEELDDARIIKLSPDNGTNFFNIYELDYSAAGSSAAYSDDITFDNIDISPGMEPGRYIFKKEIVLKADFRDDWISDLETYLRDNTQPYNLIMEMLENDEVTVINGASSTEVDVSELGLFYAELDKMDDVNNDPDDVYDDAYAGKIEKKETENVYIISVFSSEGDCEATIELPIIGCTKECPGFVLVNDENDNEVSYEEYLINTCKGIDDELDIKEDDWQELTDELWTYFYNYGIGDENPINPEYENYPTTTDYPGPINTLIANMLADVQYWQYTVIEDGVPQTYTDERRYDEEEICNCWMQVVDTYEYDAFVYDDDNHIVGRNPDYDLISRFLDCTGRHYIGHTTVPYGNGSADGYIDNAHKYFYWGNAATDCDEYYFADGVYYDKNTGKFYETATNEEYDYDEVNDGDILGYYDILSKYYTQAKRWEIIYGCVQNPMPPELAGQTPDEPENPDHQSFYDEIIKAGYDWEEIGDSNCKGRRDEFRQRVRDLYETNGYYVEGSDYFIQEDGTYDFDINSGLYEGDLKDVLDEFKAATTIEKVLLKEDLECLADALVDHCKMQFLGMDKLEIEDEEDMEGIDRLGLKIEEMMKAIYWDFELAMRDENNECDRDYKKVSAKMDWNSIPQSVKDAISLELYELILSVKESINPLEDNVIDYDEQSTYRSKAQAWANYLKIKQGVEEIVQKWNLDVTVMNFDQPESLEGVLGNYIPDEGYWSYRYTAYYPTAWDWAFYNDENFLYGFILYPLHNSFGVGDCPFCCLDDGEGWVESFRENWSNVDLTKISAYVMAEENGWDHENDDARSDIFQYIDSVKLDDNNLPFAFYYSLDCDHYNNHNNLCSAPVLNVRGYFFRPNPKNDDPKTECEKGLCFKWVERETTDFEITRRNCKDRNAPFLAEELESGLDNIINGKLDEANAVIDEALDPYKLNDELKVSWKNYYNNYTLYYYDRAGNLVKTIPPKGFNDDFDSYIGTDPQTGKEVLNRNFNPYHQMKTTYKYNNIGELLSSKMIDESYETNYFYNDFGQLRFSQSPRQKDNNYNSNLINVYSYTLYDDLGRVTESGEITKGGTLADISASAQDLEPDELPQGSEKTTYIQTVYSTPFSPLPTIYGTLEQKFLRNRVSYTFRDHDGKNGTSDPGDRVYTIYSYDPHGNVEWMIEMVPPTETMLIDAPALTTMTAYEYDLISGNVLKVKFQEGKADQFFHKYTYDEDNRLVKVETSHDGELWDTDAQYKYALHGPLQRIEIGDDSLQGVDYLYTINGWLKSINHSRIGEYSSSYGNSDFDPGKDANNADGTFGSNEFATDAFGEVLNYYSNDFVHENIEDGPARFIKSLYKPKFTMFNGNISSSETGFSQHILDFGGALMNEYDWKDDPLSHLNNRAAWKRTAYLYTYDMLGRLVGANYGWETYSYNFTSCEQDWGAPFDDYYDVTYTYDANGNITHLKRNGPEIINDDDNRTGLEMDDLTLNYPAYSNQLSDVNENAINYALGTDYQTEWYDIHRSKDPNVTASEYTYTYDASGNLIAESFIDDDPSDDEETEAIAGIQWTPDNKVSRITKANNDSIVYYYNAAGQRVKKTYYDTRHADYEYIGLKQKRSQYYGLNAGGQVMAVYKSYTDKITDDADLTVPDHEVLIPSEWLIYGKVGHDRFARSLPQGDLIDVESDYFDVSNAPLDYPTGTKYTRTLEFKEYELKDHLNNVRLVFSDLKLPWTFDLAGTGPFKIGHNKTSAEVIYTNVRAVNNYYPFGMLQPRAFWQSDEFSDLGGHNYGFNGMEEDDDIKGPGNSLTTEFRMNDSRLGGRWWSIDPVVKPWESPYAGYGNNPIVFVDPSGLDVSLRRNGKEIEGDISNGSINKALSIFLSDPGTLAHIAKFAKGGQSLGNFIGFVDDGEFSDQNYIIDFVDIIKGGASHSVGSKKIEVENLETGKIYQVTRYDEWIMQFSVFDELAEEQFSGNYRIDFIVEILATDFEHETEMDPSLTAKKIEVLGHETFLHSFLEEEIARAFQKGSFWEAGRLLMLREATHSPGDPWISGLHLSTGDNDHFQFAYGLYLTLDPSPGLLVALTKEHPFESFIQRMDRHIIDNQIKIAFHKVLRDSRDSYKRISKDTFMNYMEVFQEKINRIIRSLMK